MTTGNSPAEATDRAAGLDPATAEDPIFSPLEFRNLTVKNRVFRSNISGRFDNYDGSGSPVRINWELKFARGGVGTIISSFVPVVIEGRIVPNYATIDHDDRIRFWRELGERVHEHGCKFIMQLSHGGRQRDIVGFERPTSFGPTAQIERIHGLRANAMDSAHIKQTVRDFADGARRARAAGLDGVELHSANGYLFTQFLSSAINDREDEYGGSLENRARFILEVVRAIRTEVGDDFHLQAKISAVDHNNAVLPWEPRGNTINDSVQVCRWLEEAGVDAIHVSTGSMFPHPRNPAGFFPVDVAAQTYGAMISTARFGLRNYIVFRTPGLRRLFQWIWGRTTPDADHIEGLTLPDARRIKKAVSIPVICTGGFQTASVIRRAITEGDCDGVSMARTLVANNDLVNLFAGGHDQAPRPCTYCNRCLIHTLQNPLGCYEEKRFDSREEMVEQVLSVYRPSWPPEAEAERGEAAPATV
ncbi:MAG: NADH:flavin oxidoreductase [Thermoleophilaceae bacterium]|nr:NADH:flavin oxidoreductase [Thermoleophilaceae bacterium]